MHAQLNMMLHTLTWLMAILFKNNPSLSQLNVCFLCLLLNCVQTWWIRAPPPPPPPKENMHLIICALGPQIHLIDFNSVWEIHSLKSIVRHKKYPLETGLTWYSPISYPDNPVHTVNTECKTLSNKHQGRMHCHSESVSTMFTCVQSVNSKFGALESHAC